MGRKLKNAPIPASKLRDYGAEIKGLINEANDNLDDVELCDILNDTINHCHVLLEATESSQDDPPDED